MQTNDLNKNTKQLVIEDDLRIARMTNLDKAMYGKKSKEKIKSNSRQTK